jgi:parallel beta-helix repeat protein
MPRNRLVYLLSLPFFLLLAASVSAAGTDVSTSITSPNWTADNSPYIVNGTIEVAKGATLTIEEGTEVKFNPGAKIVVKGELKVLGTESDPVVMSASSSAPTRGSWGGIIFEDSAVDAKVNNGEYVSGSIIRNAIIRFGSGIACDDASPYLEGNQITYNTVGIDIEGDSYAVGGLVMNASDASQNKSLVPVYIKNNTLTDNNLGININRNNGRNYISTPAGYSYVGERYVTAYILDNTINSNNNGIFVLKGDSNVITGNNIRYNAGNGLVLANTSASNLISQNSVNNNSVGISSASPSSLYLQNNIKNNSAVGLEITAKPVIFSLNNIYNNRSYNLANLVYNLAAAGNYWGGTDEAAIESAFYLVDSRATGTAVITYPVAYKPFSSVELSPSGLFDPIITSDLSSTTTVFNKLELAGIKPAGSSVYVNDTQVVSVSDQSEWSYSLGLDLGANSFVIEYRDGNGHKSAKKTVEMYRRSLINAPVVASYATSTSADSLTLTGTKPAGTGLWLNGEKIAAIGADTNWAYTVSLAKGSNKFVIVAKDEYNGVSSEVEIKVVRTAVPASDIAAEEKSLTGKTDAKLAAKLAGKLLLQVERAGLIWYVNPADGKRYLVAQDNALEIFRKLALGINETNLNLIPTKESKSKGNAALRQRLAGRLLLRVEAKGQISYIDSDGYRHDISAANLMESFRSLSLGITNANLRKITVGELK